MAFEFRCKPGDVALVAQSPFQSWYEVRTTYPLMQCLRPSFFLSVRNMFRAGDCVNLVRYSNDTWKQMLEICPNIRVAAVDSDGVELFMTSAVMSLDKPGEEGIFVDRGFAGQFVIRMDGATYATRNTIVEANELAERLAAETGKPAVLYESKRKAA